MTADTASLVRALGEHAVSMHYQCRSRVRSNEEKKAVLRWLRGLRREELASLCCVEDVGFVKTLLHMAALSRGAQSHVQEFQVLPPTSSATVSTQTKRTATTVLPRTAPRDFVKRPVLQTVDGDVIGCFRTREYEECCAKVLKGLRVLNALQSCDTVALSMEFFRCHDTKRGAFAHSVLPLFEVISCGGFLMACPSVATLKHRIWGETEWLKKQGYYPLQALFVNQIELNIWASWKQHTKDETSTVPLQGLAAKLYLMEEWRSASVSQRNAMLRVLGSKMTEHLRDLRQSVPIQASGAEKYQAARFSLESLMRILTVRQQPLLRADERVSVSSCFACAFEDAVTSPQAVVIKLLLAEHLQEQCSLLLCERLSNEEEAAVATSLSIDAVTNGAGAKDEGAKGVVKGSNHSQRRRASRKKMLRLRRRECETRIAQQTYFRSMLRELCEYFRQKQAEATACVDEGVCEATDTAINEDQLVSGSCLPKNSVRSRQRRKKKKTKEKEANTTERGDDNQSVTISLRSAVTLSATPQPCQTGDENDADQHSAAATCLYSAPSEQGEPLVDSNSDGESTPDGGPRLKFSPSLGSTRPTMSSASSAMPTFGAQPLCLSSAMAPFFLSLAPKDHRTQSSRALRQVISDEDGSNGGETCLAGPESAPREAPMTSEAADFEWYMPFQTSAQRSNLTMPALDWHFDHWQFKTSAAEDDLVAKVTMALERISTLEEKLAEKTKAMDEQASSASSEINTLNRAVATLTAQLHNIENDVQELQLQRSVPGTTGEMDDMSQGNASSCSSPPAPFSPTPSSLNCQVDSPSAAAPTFPEAYPPTHSVLGPFVSVPLSVLPPRSKLHWDLCEFAAQLQADSDSRLPAQLAAHRLCMATVQSLWPRAQVRPYGSHVTRLVLPSSDVDLVICLPKVRRDAPADAAGMLEGRNAIKETWQQNLARKLKQEPWVVSDSVKTLPHAAVPIITLLTAPPYNVRLDISFEGPGHNGLATNDVVLALLHEFPPLAPMMLILKSFAIERGLAVAYSGGLSSYALLLLVARYLQEHSDTMPNGFANASRAVQHSLSTVQAGVADFGLMLMGFLDFYGNRFDPRTTGISVASRCFLNRESSFMAGTGTPAMGDPHQIPHPYQQIYAADDAAVDDRTSQYGYCQHWQVPAQPHVQTFLPNSEGAPAHGFRRYGYRSSLDLPASQALDEMGTATGLLDYQQLQQQTYDPHKFDPVFIEDPLCPTNNVGRNCFRIMQIRRAFSAAHLALLAASRDPAVFVDNRIDLVAGVALHPDNLLRAILGAGAPVKAKPDAATSATVGVTAYMGAEHSHGFHSNNRQQVHQQQQHAYHHHHHRPPQQSHLHHVGTPPPRSVGTCRNEPASRRHSESESEKLTTRSTTSTGSRDDRPRIKHVGSPQLTPHSHGGDNPSEVQVRLLRHVSTEHGQTRKLSSLHRQHIAKRFSRKNSERSMSLSLSFADVVRDGGGTNGVCVTVPNTSRPAITRPSRFSRDDMALEESITERWETKVDSNSSELKSA
ncbi:unnamed protein product [Hyaloperonospora brassicae]|uniref:Poly(A) RNA polymerase mitochondrial-like central palm domain-containing protein n=1 Tax=Hyaloperonospora brassicae TaxID=162125 RepID=A0AAV0UEN5_HYABA|nr:unnamed protein product [Hyaloperonospora brassicae]